LILDDHIRKRIAASGETQPTVIEQSVLVWSRAATHQRQLNLLLLQLRHDGDLEQIVIEIAGQTAMSP
jgi:hypothetical protein